MIRTRQAAEQSARRRVLAAAKRCLGNGRGVVSIRLIRESGAAYRDSDDEPPLSVQETARVIVNGGRICRRLKGHVLVDDGKNSHICRDVAGLRKAGMIR